MTPIRRGMIGGHGRIIIAIACAFAAMATPSRAIAQHVVLVVNGEIITDYDIDQRTKFNTLSTHKTPARQDVIEELIDEKLKVQVGRRYKIDISDSDVDSSYADMAKRMHLTLDQLTQTLTQGGVDPKTLKARIRADTAWQYIIRGKFQSSLQINEKSVLDEMESQNQKKSDGDKVGYEYTLRPILFVVPRGNTALQEARRKDAEALRARFTSCDSGLAFARSLRDVAIREPITKNSSDLAPALRQILDKTEPGHLTAPETTQQGIELFALCEKKETKDETPEKREVREKMFSAQFQAKAKSYLRELRRQMIIERK
ncbi:MAG TPA: peptidylprolyl isomerase [Xanthobacteraceae bacterium]|nr:peptidylprolyl isomerase [Xanthobacteraceae bacterium]